MGLCTKAFGSQTRRTSTAVCNMLTVTFTLEIGLMESFLGTDGITKHKNNQSTTVSGRIICARVKELSSLQTARFPQVSSETTIWKASWLTNVLFRDMSVSVSLTLSRTIGTSLFPSTRASLSLVHKENQQLPQWVLWTKGQTSISNSQTCDG